MHKKNLEKEVRAIIKKHRRIEFNSKDDLYKKGIVDSFDILSIIGALEDKYSIKLNFAKDNKFIFSLNYVVKKIISLQKK